MNEFWAIILAAGESKRMGFPKMLLMFNGRTMIETVVKNVTDSDVDKILVVLGADRDKIAALTEKMEADVCFNINYKEGMLSSVKCGLSNLPSGYKAVLVFQGDQPFISPAVINLLIKEYKSSGKEIVIPVFKGRRGHPVLIGRRYHTEIENLDDHEGLRALAYRFAENVLEVETDEPGILRDFDTYDEYKKEINQML